ncbi:hypothetical protein D3C85_1205030 [compost metagenome]
MDIEYRLTTEPTSRKIEVHSVKLLGDTVEELKDSIAPAMAAMAPLKAMQDKRAQLRRTPKDSAACGEVRINSKAIAWRERRKWRSSSATTTSPVSGR